MGEKEQKMKCTELGKLSPKKSEKHLSKKPVFSEGIMREFITKSQMRKRIRAQMKLLESSSSEERISALEEIEAMGEIAVKEVPEIVPALIQCLSSAQSSEQKDPEGVWIASKATLESMGSRVVPALVTAISKYEEEGCSSLVGGAMETLGLIAEKIGTESKEMKRASAIICKYLSSLIESIEKGEKLGWEEIGIRVSIEALGKMRSVEALPLFKKIIKIWKWSQPEVFEALFSMLEPKEKV